MLAKFKEWTTKKQLSGLSSIKFDWYLKVIKKDKKDWFIKLGNWNWYEANLLEFKKKSWGSRKPKQEVEEKETVDIDLWRVNMELKVWEYETKIRQLNKECESWMIDFNEAKREKLDFEYKYNEISNMNDSLNKRISLLVELQEQLISKKNFWKKIFLINISIDVIYLLVRYLWM